MSNGRDQHDKGCDPGQPRAVAVMRPRYDGTHEGIAEHGKGHRRREQGDVIELSAP